MSQLEAYLKGDYQSLTELGEEKYKISNYFPLVGGERKTNLNLSHNHKAHIQVIGKNVCVHIWGENLALTRLITCLIKRFIIVPLRIFSSDLGKFMEKRTQIQPIHSGLSQRVVILSIKTQFSSPLNLKKYASFQLKVCLSIFFLTK